jgi:hypothetical protein
MTVILIFIQTLTKVLVDLVTDTVLFFDHVFRKKGKERNSVLQHTVVLVRPRSVAVLFSIVLLI